MFCVYKRIQKDQQCYIIEFGVPYETRVKSIKPTFNINYAKCACEWKYVNRIFNRDNENDVLNSIVDVTDFNNILIIGQWEFDSSFNHSNRFDCFISKEYACSLDTNDLPKSFPETFNGIFKLFDDIGRQIYEGNYINGKVEGLVKKWAFHQTINSEYYEIDYKNGRMNGKYRKWELSKDKIVIMKDIDYKDDRLHGIYLDYSDPKKHFKGYYENDLYINSDQIDKTKENNIKCRMNHPELYSQPIHNPFQQKVDKINYTTIDLPSIIPDELRQYFIDYNNMNKMMKRLY